MRRHEYGISRLQLEGNWRKIVAIETQHSPSLSAAQDAINTAIAGGDERAQLTGAKCRALLVGYDRKYGQSKYIPTAVETTECSRLLNPDTGKGSRTFSLAGLLDVRIAYGNKLLLMDHKSCSCDIEDPDAPYWRQLTVEGQVTHYMLLGWLNGEKFDGAVWDVLRKPGTNPAKMKTKAMTKRVLSERAYCGRRLSNETLVNLQKTERENLEMYEARLVHDCTIDRPDRYFQRRSVPRLDSELLTYAGELWEHSQDMLYERAKKRTEDSLPVRNSGACMLYGTPCAFLGICSNYDTPDSDKWVRKENVHSELPLLQGDGRDVLTNSRIRCWQTCRRKHYYQYELGIQRAGYEESDALYFGSLWHTGLEAWWKSKLPKQETDSEHRN